MRALHAAIVAIALVLAIPASAAGATAAGPATTAGYDTAPATIAIDGTGDRPAVRTTPPSGLRVDGRAARIVVPEQLPDAWDFLGAAGDVRFQLPGAGAPGLPTLGFSSSAAADTTSTTLTVRTSGPGDVIAFTGGAGSDTLRSLIDTSADPTSTIDIPPGAWLSPTWIFTAAGAYTLEITPTIDGVSGSAVTYDIDVDAAQVGRSTTTASTLEPCFASEVPADAVTVADGHFDFGVQVAGDTLISRVKDDRADPAVWRHPAATVFRLDDTGALEVPDDSGFAFLGVPGATVWNIGQTQQDGIPWLGWNTQHPSAVGGIEGTTQWRLDDVTGPGELFVYQTGSFGAMTKMLSTADGWPTTVSIPANTHAHANWSFTEPGAYKVTTTHTATLTSGRTVSSQETLTFLVGPCASAPTRPSADVPSDKLLDDGELIASNRNGLTASPSTVQVGARVTIAVPGAQEGAWFMPVFYSTPQQTSWKASTAAATLADVTVPQLAAGPHKVAVHDATGALVGWAPLTVSAAAPDVPTKRPGKKEEVGAKAPGDGLDEDAGAAVPGTAPAAGSSSTAQICGPSSGGGSGGGVAPGGVTGGEAGTPGTTDGSGSASVVSTGHFDFGSQIQSGQLVPRVKDDRTQPPRWVSPTSFDFALGTKAEQKIPAGSSYSFLGAPGSTVWLVPQTQVDGVPWLGWNTQDESVRSTVKGDVTFTLDSVSGPGKLGVYLTDSFGGVGEKKFGNIAGFPSSFDVPLNVHAHGNWAFTAAGTYQVTITQKATLSSGKTVSAPATLTFRVGAGTSASSSSASLAADGNRLTAAVATATPAPAAEQKPANEATCILPAAGAPDVVWFLAIGMLLLAMGIAVTTVAATRSPRAAA